jgi:hypothetical protein
MCTASPCPVECTFGFRWLWITSARFILKSIDNHTLHNSREQSCSLYKTLARTVERTPPPQFLCCYLMSSTFRFLNALLFFQHLQPCQGIPQSDALCKLVYPVAWPLLLIHHVCIYPPIWRWSRPLRPYAALWRDRLIVTPCLENAVWWKCLNVRDVVYGMC